MKALISELLIFRHFIKNNKELIFTPESLICESQDQKVDLSKAIIAEFLV
tara:strand:+ start:212 stop:361 length:150 start_codon:yes stop_codon:yes gene_type:complete